MENIKKVIHLKIMEIFIVVGFMILSSFLWSSLHFGEVFTLLEEPTPTSYAYVEVLKNNAYVLYPMNDEIALQSLMPNSVSMVNDTYLDTTYAFGLRSHKSSTLDYQNLKISIQGKAYYLKNFFFSEDEEYNYFLFEKGSIQASTILYDVKLWVDVETTSSTYGKTFDYEFLNLENLESV